MNKAIIGTLVFLIIAVVALPPVALGTRTYPVAIVDGNSMYPTLHNGDIALYRGAGSSMIQNGTIVVAIPGETGLTMTDQILAPTVIHRVVGTVIQADGTVYYKTKGDNNAQADPWLTRSDHVLGVPVGFLPYVGALITFAKSTQGLMVMLGAVLFVYLSRIEDRVDLRDERAKLVGALADLALSGDISRRDFDKLELAVEHADTIDLAKAKDGQVLALLDWVRTGAGAHWAVKKVTCPRCGGDATAFEGGSSMFVLCKCQSG